ncbi:hypothetical protein [Pseudomonas putida]|uniref:Uncharacterized protein n=1 Tax=Pseudomonas putida TaxID=303 RepID=A0A6I7EEJ0_PSEPU|nr:hypothetical protein [Pseudomonas putida]QHW08371.1 hypothetical protein C2H86_28605 [Pseudomonas putida]
MIDFVLQALRSNPEIAVFMAIALGMLLGRLRLGSFHLGQHRHGGDGIAAVGGR